MTLCNFGEFSLQKWGIFVATLANSILQKTCFAIVNYGFIGRKAF